jgi:Gti1/Pac2 family transcription factor
MSSSTVPLNPTFVGHIASTLDALILFEACLRGEAQHVPRRPHDRERQELIRSGNVFIYEEHSSGIKRWTDGVAWSPSRILGNFLIYRELDRPFQPGEKKRAIKRNKKPGVSKHSDGVSRSGTLTPSSLGLSSGLDASGVDKETERALIGSLIDSYPFKPDGLVKKTISVTYNGVPHHLVSYYNLQDVMSGSLITPTKSTRFRHTMPRSDLIMSQNFRAPIDEVEWNPDERGGHTFFTPGAGPDMSAHNGALHRAMSLPNVQAIHLSPFASPNPFGIQPQVPSFLSPMPPSVGGVPYAPQSQGNYSFDPARARFASTAGLVPDLSRTLPASPLRRHSTAIEQTNPSTGFNLFLSSIQESRALDGNPYLDTNYLSPRQSSAIAPPESFPSPRAVPADSTSVSDDRHAHLGPEELGRDNSWTSFHGLENGQSQYLGGGPPWTGGPSLGRT